jgi:hypothetical protein
MDLESKNKNEIPKDGGKQKPDYIVQGNEKPKSDHKFDQKAPKDSEASSAQSAEWNGSSQADKKMQMPEKKV